MLPVSIVRIALSIIAFTSPFLHINAATISRSKTSGCGLPHQNGLSTDITIQSGGLDRQFRIHVPKNYDPNVQTPLLFSFHGATKTMADQETITRFSDPSVNPSMIAVYPQGLNNTWQGAPYHPPPLPSDTLFVTDTLLHLKSHYCISPSRIYASGMSNGGGFVNTLACSPHPGTQFAAFAPASGAFYDDLLPPSTTTCSPAFSPLPMIEFHGQADETIPYFGGRSGHGRVPSVPGWVERWARRDGCGEGEGEREVVFEEGYKRESWSCGGVEGVVVHYNISGLGHRWPTVGNSGVDASRRIVEFFDRFHK